MLIDQAMEKCIMMDTKTTSDGYGGVIVSYVEGAEFDAAFDFRTSIPEKVAAVQGVHDVYSVYTRKTVLLTAGTIFKRSADGRYFRVTTNGTDMKTPSGSVLNLSKADIEEWQLSNG